MILVKYKEDFGRMGDLEGLFITTSEMLARMKEAGEIYLGEVLGKHSDIEAELSDKTLKIVSADQDFIEKLKEVFDVNFGFVSGADILGRFLDEEADREGTPYVTR